MLYHHEVVAKRIELYPCMVIFSKSTPCVQGVPAMIYSAFRGYIAPALVAKIMPDLTKRMQAGKKVKVKRPKEDT